MTDISTEIKFKTARSGGKGGQHVNKVETMVEGYWHVANSKFFDDAEKTRIAEKLSNKINLGGFLFVKSQSDRSQLGNKDLVLKKMNALIQKALLVPKKRKPTKISKLAKQKILDAKKRTGALKKDRRKISGNES